MALMIKETFSNKTLAFLGSKGGNGMGYGVPGYMN